MATNKQIENKEKEKSKGKDITSAMKIIFWLLLVLCTITLTAYKEFDICGTKNMSWWIVFFPVLMPYALIILYIIIIVIGGGLISFLFPKK